MACILEFRKSPFRFRPLAAEPETPGSADIVLFPGVRYEREREEPAPAKPRRRARRRDRLDLED